MDTSQLISKALDQGIIDDKQSELLLNLAEEPSTPNVHEEEQFLFFRSFNEIFLSIGVAFIGLAFISLTFVLDDSFGPSMGGIVVLLAIGVLFKGRTRSTLPLVVISLFVYALAAVVLTPLSAQNGMIAEPTIPAAMAVFSMLFFAFFRLPFVLVLVAFSCVSAVLVIMGDYLGSPLDFFLDDRALLSLTLFGCGIGVLAGAMWYDLRDPERTTLNADCAFWLHISAAPLLVHPVIVHLMGKTGTEAAALSFLAFFCVLIFSLMIDRRALLISSILYLSIPIYKLTPQMGPDTSLTWPIIAGVLGSVILVSGLSWVRIRRLILKPFGDAGFLRLLPPA